MVGLFFLSFLSASFFLFCLFYNYITLYKFFYFRVFWTFNFVSILYVGHLRPTSVLISEAIWFSALNKKILSSVQATHFPVNPQFLTFPHSPRLSDNLSSRPGFHNSHFWKTISICLNSLLLMKVEVEEQIKTQDATRLALLGCQEVWGRSVGAIGQDCRL
jgi:hypothetical protein